MATSFFRSRHFVISVGSNSSRYKILHVFFSRDGSLHVNFPYFLHSNGLISVATHPGKNKTAKVSFLPKGKVVSHLVKYSHHPDGSVHFSQDGKIKSIVRKKGVLLNRPQKHIFSVMFQQIENFKRVQEEDNRNEKKILLGFDFEEPLPQAFKIIARWGEIKVLHDLPKDKEAAGFVLSPPTDNPSYGYCLQLTCEQIVKLTTEDETLLYFIGGFDPLEITEDENKSTSFLSLLYPAKEYDQLKEQLGSADFER